MSEICTVRDWGKRLRSCESPAETACCIAKAVVDLAGAFAAGIFLFDQGRESLLLTGLYPEKRVDDEPSRDIPAWKLEDPLAFCVHSGQSCSVPLDLTLAPSLDLVVGGRTGHAKWVVVEPLIAPESKIIGAIMVACPSRKQALSMDVQLLCDYAAAVLDGRIRACQHQTIVHSLQEDLGRLEQKKQDPSVRPENSIIGQSEAIETVRSMALTLSGHDVPVLITGETGTGKEVVATAIHCASARCHGPFVQINCAALPPTLLESELFGHRKGAFSSANSDHHGLFRSANGGTILLDEIGEMPLEVQAKLLRVLQEHTVRPVGDVRFHAVNIRILAATNMDMTSAVETGRFRRDLYHRLAVFHLKLPSLRERVEDLPLLARHHLAQLAMRYQRPRLNIAPDAWTMLRALPYPGNVREFFSMLERAVIMTDKRNAMLGKQAFTEVDAAVESDAKTLPELVSAYESSIIMNVMKFYDGKTRHVATALGIPKRTLNYKLQQMKMS
jgi:transcriptional regulator with PAS, ATPase and Fis domain